MEWQFTHIDRDGNETIINEPTGWDQTEIVIKRDLVTHGIFFDYQGNEFLFYGNAMQLLKQEYDQYGAKGSGELRISQRCNTNFEELYTGQFVFTKYHFTCGDECFVKIPIEIMGDVMNLRNRSDQKVDMYATKSFDGITDLPAYNWLGFEMGLPGKGVKLDNAAEMKEVEALLIKLGDVPHVEPFTVGGYNVAWFNIVPKLDNNVKAEFGNFSPAVSLQHSFICSGLYGDTRNDCDEAVVVHQGNYDQPGPGPYTATSLFDWSMNQSLLYYDPERPDNLDVIREFDVKVDYEIEVFLSPHCYINQWMNCIIKRKADGSLEVLDKDVRVNVAGVPTSNWQGWNTNTTHTVIYSKELQNVALAKDEYLFAVVCGHATYVTSSVDNNQNAYTLTQKSGSFLAKTVSRLPETRSKLFMINEVISRITEGITDGKIRAYSEYFGRTDSQPYGLLKDGCGSLEAITNGLHIRRQEARNDQAPTFPVSLEDVQSGLTPIHNIGFGIEVDKLRPGYNVMRVEPASYFYKSAIVLSHASIDVIEFDTIEQEHFSTFNFGYEKWEAEEFTGLDEFLTTRSYRTTLSSVKNSLDIISKWITSGYAWEITRRKGSTDSKDWRFDNDLFLACTARTKRYHVIFKAATNQIIIEYSGSSAPFNMPYLYITNSSFNNQFFPVQSIANDSGYITILTNAGFIVDEEIFDAQFPQTILPGGMFVETGNVTNPINIIDPATIYNYRLSPVRLALKWLSKILASYKVLDENSKVVFMDGTGNYNAQGLMTSESCRLEHQSIAEKDDLSIASFEDESKGLPYLAPERVTYSYPLSLAEFKKLKANPYELIYYRNDCMAGIGWIDEIKYKPEDGLAEFNLIPAHGNQKVLDPGIFTEPFNPQFA